MCYKASHLSDTAPDMKVAAVCVYPSMIGVARRAVGQSGVKVASVATGFPSGQYSLQTRLDARAQAKPAEELPEDMSGRCLIGGGLIAGDAIGALALGLFGLIRTVF